MPPAQPATSSSAAGAGLTLADVEQAVMEDVDDDINIDVSEWLVDLGMGDDFVDAEGSKKNQGGT